MSATTDLEIDVKQQIKAIEKILGKLSDRAPVVLSKALTSTAKRTKTLLVNKANKTYTFQINKNFVNVQFARKDNLTAGLKADSKRKDLFKFKVSPNTVSNGSDRPKYVKAKVLKSGTMKPLITPNGSKAFITKYINYTNSGETATHMAVAQRKGKDRLPIESLYSLSEHQMLRSEKVFGESKSEIEKILENYIKKNIQKEFDKLAKSKK